MVSEFTLKCSLAPFSIGLFTLTMGSLCGDSWLCRFDEIDILTDVEVRVGLWVNCSAVWSYGCKYETCETSGGTVLDFVQATRSFMIFAIAPIVFTIVSSILIHFYPKKINGRIIACGFSLAGLFLLVAMTVYTAKINENNEKGRDYSVYTYGWCHIIGWCCFVVSIMGTISSIYIDLGFKKPAEYQE